MLATSNDKDNRHPSLYAKRQLSLSIEVANHQSLYVLYLYLFANAPSRRGLTQGKLSESMV